VVGVGKSGVSVSNARDFRVDMQWSLDGSDEVFWSAVYHKAFSNLVSTELCTDLPRQKQGIDRLLHLSNGKTLAVDEKKRREVWSDILLEVIGNEEFGTPGWMEKDLAMDYLAYAFMPIQRCYLFPWPMLRRAWLQYGQDWRSKYPPKRAATKDKATGRVLYHTLNVPVPIDVLRRAVSTAAIIDLAGVTV
jgi:hypothetical protein